MPDGIFKWSDGVPVGEFLLASLRGAVNGVASLDATGKIPVAQLPVAQAAYVELYNTATQTATAGSSFIQAWNTVLRSGGGTIWSAGAANKLFAPYSGWYEITARLGGTPASFADDRLNYNSTVYNANDTVNRNAGSVTQRPIPGPRAQYFENHQVLYLTAGEYLQFTITNSMAASWTTLASGGSPLNLACNSVSMLFLKA